MTTASHHHHPDVSPHLDKIVVLFWKRVFYLLELLVSYYHLSDTDQFRKKA